MKPEDYVKVEQLYQAARYRLHLKEWESVTKLVISDDLIMVGVSTYEVKVLVREDRYEKRGTRIMFFKRGPSGWHLSDETCIWDDDFEPFVFEKIGRRKTADEFQEQREWEKLCYRPGTAKTPLDSYQRVWNDKSTPKMEKYW